MTERSDHLMAIGVFSQTTRLSVKALRLYDEIGLLTPEHVDSSNGYRYYGPAQTGRAEAIRLLRSVDMPLEDIGRVLDSSPEVRDRIMAVHMGRLEAGLTVQKRRIEAFNDLMEGRRQLMPYEVHPREVESQHVASITSEVDLGSIAAAVGAGFSTIVTRLTEVGITPSGAPFLVLHDVIDEENSGKIEICIPVPEAFETSEPVSSNELPGGLAASTIHRGAYEEVPPAYHALSSWMSANGWEPYGPPREVYLNDPTEVTVSEQLTEILWPITKVIETNGVRS